MIFFTLLPPAPLARFFSQRPQQCWAIRQNQKTLRAAEQVILLSRTSSIRSLSISTISKPQGTVDRDRARDRMRPGFKQDRSGRTSDPGRNATTMMRRMSSTIPNRAARSASKILRPVQAALLPHPDWSSN